METKTQIVEPHEIRTILMRNFYGTDIDKDFDSKSFCEELAEYMDKWIQTDRENQHDNAVTALKKIANEVKVKSEIYDGNVAGYIRHDVERIILDTYGKLP